MGSRERVRRGVSPAFLPALLLALLLLPAPSFRGTAQGADLSLDVGVVIASNEGSAVDPALGEIHGKLRSMFNYTSYQFLGRQRKSLNIGETGRFELPGGRILTAAPSSVAGKKVRIAIEIQEGGKNLLSTTLGLSRGGMVIVGGPYHQNGVLVLLISAE